MTTCKTCSRCKKNKPVAKFFNNSRSKDGKNAACKDCIIAQQRKRYRKNKAELLRKQKAYYQKNKELINIKTAKYAKRNSNKIKNRCREYYIKNRDKILRRVKAHAGANKQQIQEYQKEYSSRPGKKEKHNDACMKYYFSNREKVNTANRKKWKEDPKFRIRNLMSCRIRLSLKNGKGDKSWKGLVDYTVEELIRNLKGKIPKGYTWKDFLDGKLHIDHKIPVAVFNFKNPEDTDFKKCWALKNLQLLPAIENIKKGAKIDKHFQPSLLGI